MVTVFLPAAMSGELFPGLRPPIQKAIGGVSLSLQFNPIFQYCASP